MRTEPSASMRQPGAVRETPTCTHVSVVKQANRRYPTGTAAGMDSSSYVTATTQVPNRDIILTV